MSAIRAIDVGDREAWLAGFGGLVQLDHRAAQCTEWGHDLSAMSCGGGHASTSGWRQRSTPWTVLWICRPSRESPMFSCRHDPRSAVPFRTVEIPYEQDHVPGYLISPSGPLQSRPTVMVQGGIDAFSEEMSFKLGEVLVRRGYTVLLPDGPGQGESKRRGIGTRADYEVAVTAFIDFLVNRDEVDPRRIALVGSSMEATSRPRRGLRTEAGCSCRLGCLFMGCLQYPRGMTADVESIRPWPRLPSTPSRNSWRRLGLQSGGGRKPDPHTFPRSARR